MSDPRFASIDVGSNTIKLVIAEARGDGGFTRLLETARPTRLGEGIHARRLREVAIRRAVETLAEFAALCRQYGVARIAAVGTSALRDALNRDEFIERAREVGIEVEAISGEDEARLSFTAVRRDPFWRDAARLLVVDIGGGSTEVILGDRNEMRRHASLCLGAVRLTEAALHSDPPTIQQISEANRIAASALQGLDISAAKYTAVGVGGTLTNMGRVALRETAPAPETLHGLRLTLEEIERQIEDYASRTIAQRRTIVGLDADRADIILGGAIIVCQVLQKAAIDAIAISTRGLRWGLLYDRFGT